MGQPVGEMVDAVLDAIDKPLRAFHERLKAVEARAIDAGALTHAPLPGSEASNGSGAMSLQDAFDAGFLAMKDFIDRELAARDARIAALEGRPVLRDAGVWRDDTAFHPGDIVSHDGSAWICKTMNSRARPGTSDVWRLLVKRGRDARDSK